MLSLQRVFAALLLLCPLAALAAPPPIRDLPLAEIQERVGGKPNWTYANYTAGRGRGAASMACPSPVVVGSTLEELTVSYTADAAGVAPGGTVSVWFPPGSTPPQADDPAAPGHLSVTSGGTALTPAFEQVWFFRPMKRFQAPQHRLFATATLEQGLGAGETVVFTWRNVTAPRFARRWAGDPFLTRVYADHDADGWEEEIAASPWVPLVSLPANRLAARTRSMAVVGEPVRVAVMALDANDNPDRAYRGVVRLAAEGEGAALPPAHAFTAVDAGSHAFEVTFDRPGYHWLTAIDEAAGFSAAVNPVEVFAATPRYRLYWGDLHVHTEMSADAINAAHTVSSYEGSYRIGRDRYGLDFMANTDHHGWDQGNYSSEDWADMVRTTNAMNAPGRFVTLVAAEMSHGKGDQNIYFRGDTAPFLQTGPNHPYALWDFLQGRECFAVPHHFAQSMRAWDWENFDPELMRIAEIFSNHGRGEYVGNEPHYSHHPTPTLEGRTWQDQLARGRKLGAIAASDDHWARPGCLGLAGVWAEDLTREAIYDALKARRCCATTNARAILRVDVNGAPMGSVIPAAEVSRVTVRGATPSPILEAHVLRNNAVVYEAPFDGRTLDFTWEDAEADGPAWYYVRVKMAPRENAEMGLRNQPEFAWSSPVWVEE